MARCRQNGTLHPFLGTYTLQPNGSHPEKNLVSSLLAHCPWKDAMVPKQLEDIGMLLRVPLSRKIRA